MTIMEAKVSFFDMQASAVDAVVAVEDGQLSLEASGRPVGRWSIRELSPRMIGDAVLVSAEGEELVIDAADPEALSIALRIADSSTSGAGSAVHPPAASEPSAGRPNSQGRHFAPSAPSDRSQVAMRSSDDPVSVTDPSGAQSAGVADHPHTVSLLREINDRRASLATAQAQLGWVEELGARTLPVALRTEEVGLGVVQDVRLKERRPLPGSDGLQPWVVVDSGAVYLTDTRLIFSGAQDVEFEFDEINKKGASPKGLLLGVTSRSQTHILAGPGERLAVVLTAAEKIARGIDPTLPFREAIARLRSDIEQAERRLEALGDSIGTRLQADQPTGIA